MKVVTKTDSNFGYMHLCPTCKEFLCSNESICPKCGEVLEWDTSFNKEKIIAYGCPGCCHINNELRECDRVGECGDNKGKKGICWMESSEGEY